MKIMTKKINRKNRNIKKILFHCLCKSFSSFYFILRVAVFLLAAVVDFLLSYFFHIYILWADTGSIVCACASSYVRHIISNIVETLFLSSIHFRLQFLLCFSFLFPSSPIQCQWGLPSPKSSWVIQKSWKSSWHAKKERKEIGFE